MPFSAEDCGVKSLILKSRLKSILGTVYLTCWGWFGAGAPRCQGFAGLLLEGLDEFGTAERASGSIVLTDRLGRVVLAGAGQVGTPVEKVYLNSSRRSSSS